MLKRSVYAKRFALCFAAFFIALAPAVAQDMEFSFSNELSSDIVNVSSGGAEFAGIEDEVVIDITSERFDLGIDVVFGVYSDDVYGTQLSYSIEDFDWYTAFRPVSVFEIGLSKDYYFAGSYLYVEDDNVAGSKIGSDGLSFVFLGDGAGVPGLKVGLTVPFDFDAGNPFSSEFDFGFGAEYAFRELFTVGAAVNNIINNDDRVISVAAAFFPIEGLEIYAGYSFNDQEGLMDVFGQHLLNASVAYSADKFAVGADFLTNFGVNTASDYDLYAALYGEFRIIDPLLVFLTLSEQNTLGDNEMDWVFSIAPGVELDTAIGAFSLEVEVGLADGGFDYVCFPLSWTYEF